MPYILVFWVYVEGIVLSWNIYWFGRYFPYIRLILEGRFYINTSSLHYYITFFGICQGVITVNARCKLVFLGLVLIYIRVDLVFLD